MNQILSLAQTTSDPKPSLAHRIVNDLIHYAWNSSWSRRAPSSSLPAFTQLSLNCRPGGQPRGYVRCNPLFVYLHSAGVTCRRFHMKDGGASCKEVDRSVMSAVGRQWSSAEPFRQPRRVCVYCQCEHIARNSMSRVMYWQE